MSSILGFFAAAAVLELLLATSSFDRSLITYASGNDAPRKQLMAATHQRLPFKKQLMGCIKYLFGPSMVVNGVGLTLLMRLVQPAAPDSWLPQSFLGLLWQFVALSLLGDLGLYWGE